MKNTRLYRYLSPLILLLLVACSENNTTANTASNTNPASTEKTAIATDNWLGKWYGPEGTFIEISGGDATYTIIIVDLDGPKQYQGTSDKNKISFERNGSTEIIQASNGIDTGMKWLAEKSNCLKVRLGEGWCRD